MSFESPEMLLGLLLIPAVVVLYVWHERRRRESAAAFTNPALTPNVVDRAPGRRRYLPLAVLLVALAAMVVGVARPHATVSVKREEATVILAIDTSRSMGATDVKPTRLDAARNAAQEFVRKVPERYRVAVVSFGSRAVVALPPTADRSLVTDALNSLRTGEGTAIGDAVSISVKLAKRQRTSDGVVPPASVLLISDGARDGGQTSPQAAARQAKAAHVPVYTVLVGTRDGTVVQTLTGGYRQIIHVPPAPATLRQLATATGGQFFTATTDSGLKDVYGKLGSRLGHKKESREVTDVFAAGSAVLLLLGGALSAFWFRRVL